MDAQPLISVAMPMRDAERTLAMALASLFFQSYSNWELILIDDGSRDDSVRIAGRFADARVRLFADGLRKGLAARLNQAIDVASGTYLARMDADDVCYPERFSRQAQFLEEHRDVELLGAGAVIFGPGGTPLGLFPVRAEHAEICARPWAGFYLPHPTWMGPLKWFRAHRYDARAARAQDQELLLRTYEKSRFAALIEPLLGYRQDGANLKKTLQQRYHFSRAIVRKSSARRSMTFALRGVGGQAVKAAVDAIGAVSGLRRHLSAHRIRPMQAGEAERWRSVWHRCEVEARHRCAA